MIAVWIYARHRVTPVPDHPGSPRQLRNQLHGAPTCGSVRSLEADSEAGFVIANDYCLGELMEHGTSFSQRRIIVALLVLLVGGILTMGGLPFPVNGRYWDAANDAERIVVIDADRVQFAIAFGIAALGTLAIGVGLAMSARALVPAGSDRRRRTAGVIAMWMGALAALGALVVLLHALLATPEFFVDSVSYDVAVYGGGIAVMLGMILIGLLAWSAPPPKWAAVILIVGAPLGFVPEVQQIAVIVFAAISLVAIIRQRTSPAPLRDVSFS
jgi:hypothetical protein